jgi:hypothetical protein
MHRLFRFSELSGPRQLLIRLCQATNYGSIQDIEVKDSEPDFSSKPVVLVDLKLDSDGGLRREVDLADFALPDEVRRLMAQLDKLKNGKIARIDVRAGIPRRLLFEHRLSESLP